MKVILVNGSPHEKGCTYTALAEVAYALEQEGIETDIFWIGTKALRAVLPVTAVPKLQLRFSLTRSMNFWSWHLFMTAIFLVRLYIGLQPEER